MSYCIYLRKSRADLDAELHGEGETLARHERLLLDLAKRNNYNITQIYREVVSGENIADRPVVQQLLGEVEQGLWEGVLVVEVERLARGNTIDQGRIALAFQSSDTLIITPTKVYDPCDEFDEEYFEFGLFMSRREYKTINRRLQRGRIASAKEGKYLASTAPYGYERVPLQNDKGWTLQPIEEQANIVRLIFALYTQPQVQPDGGVKTPGLRSVCNILNKSGICSPQNNVWSPNTVRNILTNPTYIGKIRWKATTQKKIINNNNVEYVTIRTPRDEQIIANGIHPPIVDEEVFNKAQNIINRRNSLPVRRPCNLVNPFAGVLICGFCGHPLTYHAASKRQAAIYSCINKNCNNVSSYADIVEQRILQSLSDWISEFKFRWGNNPAPSEHTTIEIKRKTLSGYDNELATLNKQLSKAHDLLEQGVYDTNIFLDRSRFINGQITVVKKKIEDLTASIEDDKQREANRINLIPKAEHFLKVYNNLPDATSKNLLLKEIIEKIEFIKTSPSPRKGPYDNFELILYPKLPNYDVKSP